jgi:hypothetical protein
LKKVRFDTPKNNLEASSSRKFWRKINKSNKNYLKRLSHQNDTLEEKNSSILHEQQKQQKPSISSSFLPSEKRSRLLRQHPQCAFTPRKEEATKSEAKGSEASRAAHSSRFRF